MATLACGSPLAIERQIRLEKMEKRANFLRPDAREESKNNQLHSCSQLILQSVPHQSHAAKLEAFPVFCFRIQASGN